MQTDYHSCTREPYENWTVCACASLMFLEAATTGVYYELYISAKRHYGPYGSNFPSNLGLQICVDFEREASEEKKSATVEEKHLFSFLNIIMPLFGSKRDSSEDYDQQFHPGPTAGNGQNGNTSRFARRSGSIGSHTSGGSSDVHNDTGSRRGSLLTKFRSNNSLSNSPNTNAFAHDPAIKAARQKVTDAEHAESDADRALEMARGAVREARQHVKDLEAAAIQE
ncbi:hypothetical protein Clacol_000420 [Clathrus columnatus]|uniref:Uncharacterized protein n=1 Tax=Clathrus columnatus TaxID=1419009 RepID=A0AAV4ZZQ4_9AGAM|nr:hypothetical protein Clacol_000420 [Clathrus columnatus]